MQDVALPFSQRAMGKSANWFYAWMALACFVVAIVGFMPTYFVPLSKGAFHAAPLVHIHGIILFSWVSLFCAQTWLVATGRVSLDFAAKSAGSGPLFFCRDAGP
jgi:hypothetical protein